MNPLIPGSDLKGSESKSMREKFIEKKLVEAVRKRVTIYHILTKDTIDESVMKALDAKDCTQRRLIDAVKAQLHGATPSRGSGRNPTESPLLPVPA